MLAVRVALVTMVHLADLVPLATRVIVENLGLLVLQAQLELRALWDPLVPWADLATVVSRALLVLLDLPAVLDLLVLLALLVPVVRKVWLVTRETEA
ncbi:hypothetical protein GJAV_G00017050 [Gymnothorax javanicus]|nr:hypothetical protein GJAV_G00017050 [Gymnothorax javanicus]